MFKNAISVQSVGDTVTARCSIVCNEAAVYLTIGPLSGFADPEAARQLAFGLLTAADEADRHNEQAQRTEAEKRKRGAA